MVSSRSGKGGKGTGKRDTEGWRGGRGKGKGRAAPAAPRWGAAAADAKPAGAPTDTSGEWQTVPDRSGGGTPPRGQHGEGKIHRVDPDFGSTLTCTIPVVFDTIRYDSIHPIVKTLVSLTWKGKLRS